MEPTISAHTITDLRAVPWLADTVADRLWREWWKDERYKDHVRERVRTALQGAAFPQVLVAHREGNFVGTLSIVDSDMEPRRDLTPWLSALWVDSNYRRQGVATALINAALAVARGCGRDALHLMAKEDLVAFYTRRGWKEVSGTWHDVMLSFPLTEDRKVN